jgi:hypothetical protein
VQALCAQGIPPVNAIRKVLDRALNELEASTLEEAGLPREHYIGMRSIEALAADYARDPSTLHRQRNRLVAELAAILAQHNHEASRQQLIERFSVGHPVVGFEQLANDLFTRLGASDGPQGMILEGMGGLGKTTLAQMVAQRCAADRNFAGVLWVSAKQIEFNVWAGKRQPVAQPPLNPDDLLFELARELQLELPGDRATLEAEVRAHCQRSRYLIVFDNLESVADLRAIGPLITLVAGRSRILITTRDQAVDALPNALTWQRIALHELPAPASYELLRQAARFTEARALAAASEAELAQVVDVTGGNPLALWLVAGQARSMPWTSFIQDLVAARPRGSSTYELYDYLYRRSWEQLGPDAQLALFAMHRYEGGATEEELQIVSGLDDDPFRAAVTELRYHMLLHCDGLRYHIHRLTYTFLRVVIAGWWE